MAELQALEAPATAATTIVPVAGDNNLGQTLAPKRQRRPSVRLGDIGGQPATLSYDSHIRKTKPWRFTKDSALPSRASKTRPLTNLVNGGDCHDAPETDDNGNLEFSLFANRKPKTKRAMATKRVRSSWVSKVDDGNEGDEKYSSREDGDEGFRDFDPDGSESPLKEQSPVHSVDNVALDLWHAHRRPIRARVSVSREQDVVELDGVPESDSRDRICGTSADRNLASERGMNPYLDDGVRTWLIELGLGRYAPVFEIHEVDEDVLPMLTLEDLKDMGINAVGSRRKMYAAILKLRKRFS